MKPKEFLKTFKRAFFSKKNFLEDVKEQSGIKKAVSYFIVLTFLVVIFSTYRYLTNINSFFRTLYLETGIDAFNINLVITPQVYTSFFFGLTIAIVLFSFAKYWFTHIFILIFNKEAKYKDTYNSLTYTITPAYVGIPFFVVGLFILSMTSNLYFIILAIILLFIYIILELYALFVRTRGLAKIHNISMFKSFMCIYVFSSITMGIALALLLGIIVVPLVMFSV